MNKILAQAKPRFCAGAPNLRGIARAGKVKAVRVLHWCALKKRTAEENSGCAALQARTAGLSSNHGVPQASARRGTREPVFIIPLPRPLRQALCGGLFPSFQRRKGIQPQGREGAAKRKGRRAAAMRGGERRQRAHAPSATFEKNPRTDKERQQQPRARARDGSKGRRRDGDSSPVRARSGGNSPAQG